MIVNTYAVVSESQLLKTAAIPFVGISLILYLIIKTKLEQPFQKLIFAGLVLSMAGDIQLLFSSGSQFYFLMAMVATILAYILYAMAYSVDFNKNFSVTKKIILPLAVTLCISVFTLYISAPNNFDEILILVIAYFLALSVMAILSGYRFKSVNRKSFRMIVAGSIAFLISDLSIGYFYFV